MSGTQPRMVTLVDSVMDRYGNQEEFESDDSGFVCFVSISSSPQVKQGLLPPVMTLIDYNIEYCGNISAINYKLSHISELDLANNLISSWQEVENILTAFKGLVFLNLANNLLSENFDDDLIKDDHPQLRKVGKLHWIFLTSFINPFLSLF